MSDERSTRRVLPIVLWCLAFVGVAAGLQMALPMWFDADTGYHIAVGHLIREHGVLHEFPWTPFSLMAERYADTELVFHLLFAGLADVSSLTSARIAGALLGAVLLATLYFVLRSEKVSDAGLWTLLALASSGAFLVRFASVRPHLLSVPLAVLGLWAAVRLRWVVLAVVAVLYPLCYLGWVQLIGLVVIAEIARKLAGQRMEWRPLAIVIAGIGAGLLVHPNFPAIVEHAWVEIAETLFSTAWGDRSAHAIGGEFNAFSPKSMLRFVLLPASLTVLALAVAVKRRKDVSAMAAAFALAAAVYLTMTLGSQRFLEYLAPFAAVAAGLAVVDAKKWILPTVLILCVGYTALVGHTLFRMALNRTDMFPPETTEKLREAIPVDAAVFTCDWQFTGEMMLALPNRTFMVALDPVLFHRKDAELYALWTELVRNPLPEGAAVIREYFGASHVMCEMRPQFRPFIEALFRDSGATSAAVEWPWVVFKLADADTP